MLGFDRAFYGLVAAGWDLSSFEAPGAKEQLPEQAMIAELLVGFFDTERATGVVVSANDFNWNLDSYHDEHGLPHPSFRMTEELLSRIRAFRAELFARWRDLPSGDTLELVFNGAAAASGGPDTQARRTP